MAFKCNCCGAVEDIPQWGAGDGASVSNDGSPPKDWRTIYTVIERHDGKAGISTSTGEVLHSCADCNVHMDVGEHLEAEFESRKHAMFQPPEPTPKVPGRARGGHARAAKMTPERRSAQASNAARARWAKRHAVRLG